MLSPDFHKSERDAAGKAVSPLALRLERDYVGPNPTNTTVSQAVQAGIDATFAEVDRILKQLAMPYISDAFSQVRNSPKTAESCQPKPTLATAENGS